VRYAGSALIAGGVALLVLIVVLWRATRVPADAAATSRAPVAESPILAEDHRETLASKPTPTPATARPRSGTVEIPKTLPGPPTTATDSPPPALDPPAQAEKKHVPIASLPVLREAVATLDGAVADCVRRFGAGVTGVANLSFIAAPNKNRVDIESTGVIEDGTTITNQDLLECMHKTALALKFPFQADTQAVFARRMARLDNGKLAEQHIVNFSYIP
jgi:hypothetical protein